MSVLTAGGAEDEPRHPLNIARLFAKIPFRGRTNEPKRLSENVINSLASRGCKISEIQRLLDISEEYKATWKAEIHIVWHRIFGWQEMLQYRPGLLAAAVLKAQKKLPDPMTPSFQQAVCRALGWPIEQVLGFQMGIECLMLENPSGMTNDAYLDGIALGYMFYESRLAKEEGER